MKASFLEGEKPKEISVINANAVDAACQIATIHPQGLAHRMTIASSLQTSNRKIEDRKTLKQTAEEQMP